MIDRYSTCDVINVRYMSWMASQWRNPPPVTSSGDAIQLSISPAVRHLRLGWMNNLAFKVGESSKHYVYMYTYPLSKEWICYPCLLPWVLEFIDTQLSNVTLGLQLRVVLKYHANMKAKCRLHSRDWVVHNRVKEWSVSDLGALWSTDVRYCWF